MLRLRSEVTWTRRPVIWSLLTSSFVSTPLPAESVEYRNQPKPSRCTARLSFIKSAITFGRARITAWVSAGDTVDSRANRSPSSCVSTGLPTVTLRGYHRSLMACCTLFQKIITFNGFYSLCFSVRDRVKNCLSLTTTSCVPNEGLVCPQRHPRLSPTRKPPFSDPFKGCPETGQRKWVKQ